MIILYDDDDDDETVCHYHQPRGSELRSFFYLFIRGKCHSSVSVCCNVDGPTDGLFLADIPSYIRYLFFNSHINYQLSKMVNIKSDINQQDFKIKISFESFVSLTQSTTSMQVRENSN